MLSKVVARPNMVGLAKFMSHSVQLLNWVRALPDRPFESHTRLIGHKLNTTVPHQGHASSNKLQQVIRVHTTALKGRISRAASYYNINSCC